MKCASGFSRAGLGNDEVSFAIAASRAAWNSGAIVGAVSFRLLAAALSATAEEEALSLASVADREDTAFLIPIVPPLTSDLCAVKAYVELDAPKTSAADRIADENFMVYCYIGSGIMDNQSSTL